MKNFKSYLKNCRAILIFPEVYEGGFFFGAKGGNGLLLIRQSQNKFSGPFFYSIGGLSVGLQFGVKSGKVVMTIMTNRGLKSILKERIKFGVDVDAVVDAVEVLISPPGSGALSHRWNGGRGARHATPMAAPFVGPLGQHLNGHSSAVALHKRSTACASQRDSQAGSWRLCS